MRPDNLGANPTRHRRRGALAVVSLALLPALALTVFASHLAAQTAHASGSVSFAPGATYSLGVSTPRSAAIGDLNGDGHPDVVTANSGSNDVSVLLGDGTGVFRLLGSYPSGTNPNSVAVADLNGDGHPDLVTANSGSNDVSVLLGDGTGAFAAAQSFAVGASPASVAIGDLNGDGKPDVVTANSGSNDVSVLLNTTITSSPTPTPTAGGGGSGNTQVTLALAAGELSATTNAAPSLSATLNGQDQTLNYSLPITVTDGTATGNGWNLTITSTQFSTVGPPANTLPTTASTAVSVASVCASGSCVDPTNTVSYPITIPAGTAAPTPVKLFNAATGSGMGIFTVTPSVNILVPAATIAGTYTSTITLAIVSGP
jgi:hypothetical protein